MAPTPEPSTGARTGDRIAKLLARAGVASRREIERMIAEGRVALNGTVLDTPATVLRSLQGVTVDGQPVALPEPTRLFLYHKPTGLLVTERDPKGRTTIYDRLPRDLPRLVPVGRLDLNTEGLLLLTTDGGFKRQMELPSTGVERSYRARAYGNVTQAQLEELAEGVEIEGIRYGSIDANIERRTGANVWIEITITEGKNREVRRVLEHLGLQVSRLIRTRYGPFVLGDLPMGGVGEVKQHEVVAFRRTLKGGAPDEPAFEAPRPGFRAAPTGDRSARTRTRPDQPAERPTRPTRSPTEPERPGFRAKPTADRSARTRTRPDQAAERSERPARSSAEAQRPGFRAASTTDRSARSRTRPDQTAERSERPTRNAAGAQRPGFRAAPTADRSARTRTRQEQPTERTDRPARAATSDRPQRPASARPPRADAPGDRPARSGGARPATGKPFGSKPTGARPPRRDGPSGGSGSSNAGGKPGGRPPRGRRP